MITVTYSEICSMNSKGKQHKLNGCYSLDVYYIFSTAIPNVSEIIECLMSNLLHMKK